MTVKIINNFKIYPKSDLSTFTISGKQFSQAPKNAASLKTIYVKKDLRTFTISGKQFSQPPRKKR